MTRVPARVGSLGPRVRLALWFSVPLALLAAQTGTVRILSRLSDPARIRAVEILYIGLVLLFCGYALYCLRPVVRGREDRADAFQLATWSLATIGAAVAGFLFTDWGGALAPLEERARSVRTALWAEEFGDELARVLDEAYQDDTPNKVLAATGGLLECNTVEEYFGEVLPSGPGVIKVLERRALPKAFPEFLPVESQETGWFGWTDRIRLEHFQDYRDKQALRVELRGPGLQGTTSYVAELPESEKPKAANLPDSEEIELAELASLVETTIVSNSAGSEGVSTGESSWAQNEMLLVATCQLQVPITYILVTDRGFTREQHVARSQRFDLVLVRPDAHSKFLEVEEATYRLRESRFPVFQLCWILLGVFGLMSAAFYADNLEK